MKLNGLRLLKTLLGLVGGAFGGTIIAVPVNDLVNGSLPALDTEMLSNLIALSFFVLVVCMPVGLIGHAILYALKRHAVWYYLAGAAMGGFVFSMILFHDAIYTTVTSWLMFAFWAALCALIAWLIRRPDKDAGSPAESHF